MRVQVGPQNLKNFSQEFLLVQIVQLQSGVHLVDDGMLVDELGEDIHDSTDQSSGVAEANMNVGARNHLVIRIHAHV